MDRLAAHVVATAVLTAALAAVPSAMANPTASDPGPKATASAAASASPAAPARPAVSVPLPLPLPSERNEMEPFPCPDVQQVGDTSYARWHGVVAFSIKLYRSPKCHKLYGYAYPWLQFRLLKVHYDLGMGVFDVTHDAIDGARTFLGGAGGPDFWSSPVTVPAGTCTEALAHVFYPDTETDTFTAKVCV